MKAYKAAAAAVQVQDKTEDNKRHIIWCKSERRFPPNLFLVSIWYALAPARVAVVIVLHFVLFLFRPHGFMLST